MILRRDGPPYTRVAGNLTPRREASRQQSAVRGLTRGLISAYGRFRHGGASILNQLSGTGGHFVRDGYTFMSCHSTR